MRTSHSSTLGTHEYRLLQKPSFVSQILITPKLRHNNCAHATWRLLLPSFLDSFFHFGFSRTLRYFGNICFRYLAPRFALHFFSWIPIGIRRTYAFFGKNTMIQKLMGTWLRNNRHKPTYGSKRFTRFARSSFGLSPTPLRSVTISSNNPT